MLSIKEIKHWLWGLNIIKNCPDCGSNLKEIGYPREFWQYYKCSNDKCNFGKPTIEKLLWNRKT